MTDPRHTQPPGWATYCTIRDDNAAHQIRIIRDDNQLLRTCTCQQVAAIIAPGTTAEQILAAHRAHVADATAA